MLQVLLLQTPLREVHSLERFRCLVSKVSLDILFLASFEYLRSLGELMCVNATDTVSPVYNKLGYHWATTLLAFLTLVMSPFP